MYELCTLDNGLRLLTVTMPYAQSVSIGFFLGVGSRYESDSLAGASHFVEHMLFKGTARRPSPLQIAEAIEGKGGIFNASTGMEATLLWAKVAAGDLPETFDVLSDMLLDPTFDPKELEKERAVISEEIKYAYDAPDSLAQMRVSELQWPDHPLGRDIAGTQTSVSCLGRQALLSFLADHYRPERTVLALAGRVDHKEAVALGQVNLGAWERGPGLSFEPAPPPGEETHLHIEYRDIEQTHLGFSFAGLARNDPDRFVLRLLNVILGEGMRSRLFQEVRERLGLAYSVDSFVSSFQDAGAVSVYAGVAGPRVEQALRAVVDQLDRLRQEPVCEDELQKARDFVRGRLALSMEDSFTMAAWFARQTLLGPEVLEPDEALARLDAVTRDDIQRLAQTLFRLERLNLVVVGPYSENGDRFRNAVRF
jgi:predicted Zn-dependent peptidase